MSNLRTGTLLHPPPLPGAWSVWSQTNDCPGAYALVPADETARSSGIKYAVIRAIQKRANAFPDIELIRTDPPQETNRR